ncbi:GTPase [Ottowia sp.]|uniref:GTPase n=1 Tax=Ottowia sp. TaxID=1898956 RepID=UPI00262CAD85|nr:GTPase [Ottowia sp.]
MNRDSLRASLPALVAHTIPKNARRIHCSYFDDMPQYNAFGMQIDPQPAEGRVVAHTDEAFIVKTDRTKFVAVDKQLATLSPAMDEKVRITPYARRNFVGERLDATKQEELTTADGQPYTVTRITIGGSPPRIPLASMPSCPYLADLVEQLEIMRTPDGWRTIAIMLVDAKAKDIEIIDPDEDSLFKTPPEISFAVDTGKFSGRIAVVYDRGYDLYSVELRIDGTPSLALRK